MQQFNVQDKATTAVESASVCYYSSKITLTLGGSSSSRTFEGGLSVIWKNDDRPLPDGGTEFSEQQWSFGGNEGRQIVDLPDGEGVGR